MFGIEEYGRNWRFDDKISAMSESIFQMIVVHALGACSFSTRRIDSMGIDATCDFQLNDERGRRFVRFDVQLKSTTRELPSQTLNGRDCWSLQVDPEQLSKYRSDSNVPLVLVLVKFPANDEYEKWLEILTDETVLKNQVYWARIDDVGDAKSVVYVPKENRLNQESLLRDIVFQL